MGINLSTQKQMALHMADHNATVLAMRNERDGLEVKRNERINVLKLANAQRLANLEQRLNAQCSDLKQKKHSEEIMHSQRMKMLSFSQAGAARDARNRNAIDMEAQRAETKSKLREQQNKVDAANAKHHQSIEDEDARHKQQMRDMKTKSDARTVKHNKKMERMSDKNRHKTEDVNHMALYFVSLENKLKQNNARCAVHEKTLAENAQTIQQSRDRRKLLTTQSKVVQAIRDAIERDRTKSLKQTASAKRKTFGISAEEAQFVKTEIEGAIKANHDFGDEIIEFLTTLTELNEQIRETCLA